MPVQIRPVRPEDADSMVSFLVDLRHFRRLQGRTSESIRPQVREAIGQCLADDSHAIYLAVDDDGQILGYTSVHWLPYLFLPGPEGYVSELFVATAARGQGIGSQLLAVVKEEAARRGCSRLSLLNMRDRESYQRAFYAKDGWDERPDAANFVFEM